MGVRSLGDFEKKVEDLEIKLNLEEKQVKKDLKKSLFYLGLFLFATGLSGLLYSFIKTNKY